MQLVVDKIARSFGINEIFKDISFMIDKGAKQRCCAVFWLRKRLTVVWCVLNPA